MLTRCAKPGATWALAFEQVAEAVKHAADRVVTASVVEHIANVVCNPVIHNMGVNSCTQDTGIHNMDVNSCTPDARRVLHLRALGCKTYPKSRQRLAPDCKKK